MSRFRDVITIQEPTVTRSVSGQPVESWGAVTGAENIRARILPVNGKEWFAQDQRQTSVSTKISIRYIAGITPRNRVMHGAVVYNIVAVLDGGSIKAPQILMCERAS